jgi:Ca2+-binding RTX toxin-like protein
MKRRARAFTLSVANVFCLIALGACSAGDASDVATSEDALLALTNGAGSGPAVWGTDPCEAPEAYAKAHGYNFIRATDPSTHGTAGRDLIVGTDGDDVIDGGGGDDVICAGYGEDTVHGGAGDDYLDGGGDNDAIFAGEGDDIVHGRGGSDEIHGGAGDDILLGDILDDHLFGEAGADLLIGGHGTDVMMGGTGNDYLRGDTGNDAFIGGEGTDVASFITAMPPGQSEHADRPPSGANGIKVDFSNDCRDTGFAPSELGGKSKHDGCANGDGGNEPLDGIEVVIGSPYDDVFVGGASHTFVAGYGADTCDGAACGKAIPAAANEVFVDLDDQPRDTGVIVAGTKGSDGINVFALNGKLYVRAFPGVLLRSGPGCNQDATGIVCPIKHSLRHVAVFLDDGDDTAKFGSEVPGSEPFPRDFTAHASGGNGDDSLHGGDEQDVFFTGPTGKDRLYGNAGGDALLSESRKWSPADCSALTAEQRRTAPRCDENKPDAAHYTDGRDELYGGPGDDQLVTDYPCGDHLNSGGGGKDIAGFARSGKFDLTAQLAGSAAIVKDFHGRAFNPQLCGMEKGTHFEDDLEILEAADGDDELYGNDQPNTIWGREGNDVIHGLGGNDVLWGLLGDDSIYGGDGKNAILGGGGNDRIFPSAN